MPAPHTSTDASTSVASVTGTETFGVRSRLVSSGLLLTLSGELDLLAGRLLLAHVRRVQRPHRRRRATLDVAGLVFLDSYGLDGLGAAAAVLVHHGWRPRLSPARPSVAWVLAFADQAGWLPEDLRPPGAGEPDLPVPRPERH